MEAKKMTEINPPDQIYTLDTGLHKIGEPIKFVVIIAKDKE